ncbi:classical arabinogalactan protein 9-like [Miscanthus floridulus]|uniref:classical arabinogalactan protein 9-like n=1 Tax=Miscanthus floridulus TaxID=154761 RepID=UPI00345A9A50
MQQSTRPIAVAHSTSAPCAALLPAPPNADARAPERHHASLTRPFSLSRAVTPRAATSAMAELAAVASPPFRAPTRPTVCATIFSVMRRPSYTPFPVTSTAVAPSPPKQPPALCLLARPTGHRPPPSMSRPPGGAPGSSSARAYSSTSPAPPQPAGATSRPLPCATVERKKKVDHV